MLFKYTKFGSRFIAKLVAEVYRDATADKLTSEFSADTYTDILSMINGFSVQKLDSNMYGKSKILIIREGKGMLTSIFEELFSCNFPVNCRFLIC